MIFSDTLHHEKTNKIERKWTIIVRTNEINLFLMIEKMNEMGLSQTMNEQNEKKLNMPNSSPACLHSLLLLNFRLSEGVVMI